MLDQEDMSEKEPEEARDADPLAEPYELPETEDYVDPNPANPDTMSEVPDATTSTWTTRGNTPEES